MVVRKCYPTRCIRCVISGIRHLGTVTSLVVLNLSFSPRFPILIFQNELSIPEFSLFLFNFIFLIDSVPFALSLEMKYLFIALFWLNVFTSFYFQPFGRKWRILAARVLCAKFNFDGLYVNTVFKAFNYRNFTFICISNIDFHKHLYSLRTF